MNRTDFERAVWDSDLNPYARLVLLTFAGAADYRDADQEVWLSKAKVAGRTGLHPDTVKKYVDGLVKDGWLIPSKMYGRAQGFFLSSGVLTVRTLMDRSRSNNLSESPNGQEIDAPQTQDVSPNGQEIEQGRESEVSPNGPDLSPNGSVDLSPNGAGGISYPLGTNNQEQPYKNNQEEPREDSQAHPPFDKEGWRDVRFPLEERIEKYLFATYGPGTGLGKEEVDRVRSLTSTAVWGRRDFVTAVEEVYSDKNKSWDEW